MKLNLHLFSNEKFVEGAILQFEKYHPEENIYIINSDEEINYGIPTSLKSSVFFSNFENGKSNGEIKKIAQENIVKNVFIHSLDYLKAGIYLQLLKTRNFKSFWIFYGGDFYSQITDKFNFFDNVSISTNKKSSTLKRRFNSLKYVWKYGMTGKKAIQKVISELDFFCFWNEYELENVKRYFSTNAQFKLFIYTSAINFNEDIRAEEKKENILLINHSASRWGNHLTIIEKLVKIKVDSIFKEIIIPLNYGENLIRERVMNFCEEKHIKNANFLTKFLPPKVYFDKLNQVSIAVFGAKRQEGAGNVFYLLKNGTKIFLRSENPMLAYLKKCGFIVFSFEEDMNHAIDFEPLSTEDIRNNKLCYESIFNKSRIEDFMSKLMIN